MINGHLIPFFWVRTENEEELKRGIDEIYNYGITSFCVESRPFYPERVQRGKPESDFNGEEWFKRAETILDYAREKGMKVWFFDDKGFPSGIAAGKYAERRDLLPSQLICNFIDFASDGNVITLLTPAKEEDDTLLALVVTKYKDGTADFSDYTEIPIAANARTASFKIPGGVYRAAFLMRSKRFGEFPIYMDVLSDESTDFYIQELYEKHYSRLKRFYGETFCGFFSDEPRFGNGYFNYELAGRPDVFGNVLGLPGGAYPVSDETLSLLGESGYKIAELVGLYTDIGEKTSDLRVCYADIVTDIYKRNYSSKIGEWCKNHGVTYAAHIIEDLGGHCRFGCGAGHYFKAMDGLDYAGVDVVLQSLKPYFTKGKIISATGFCNADFYVHVLGKLASSSAALDENKQGRALCEIFGAYGFCETIKDMVYLVNLFIVSGINYFIPHAFTMDYPDEDCPPHFYVGKRGIGVSAYFNVCIDHEHARLHRDWVVVSPDGKIMKDNKEDSFFRPMCYHSPYREYIKGMVKEVVERYSPDGVFLDCFDVRPCHGNECVEDMIKAGLNPLDEKDVYEFARKDYLSLCREFKEIVGNDRYFYINGWRDFVANEELRDIYSHLEIEGLPSCLGYDYYATCVAYARTIKKDYLNMTGRFQFSWGDFGGYKGKASLQNDMWDSLINGAEYCVGDHMNPAGNLDPYIYKDIKEVYGELEKYEEYTYDSEYKADIAVFTDKKVYEERYFGISRMLNELKYTFDFVDEDSDVTKYKLLVFPDGIKTTAKMAEKAKKHIAAGKGVICVGDGAPRAERKKVFG